MEERQVTVDGVTHNFNRAIFLLLQQKIQLNMKVHFPYLKLNLIDFL